MKRPTPSPSGILLFLTLALFFVPPLVILSRAFYEDGSFSTSTFFSTLTNPYYIRLMGVTFLQALLSALISIIIALPAAAFFVHYDFPFKKILLSMTTLSFILPPILVVLSFVIFWGNQGTVNSLLANSPLKILYSFKAIILAHIFYNIPLALRYIYAQWSTLPQSQYEAALTQGAKKRQLFQRVVFPQIITSVGSSFLIIFLYCFMSFAIILVLGGGPKYSTLEVEVYRLIKFSFDFTAGGSLAIVETLVCLSVVSLYLTVEKGHRGNLLLGGRPLVPRRLKGIQFGFFWIFLLLWGVFFGGPILALIGHSFEYRPSRSATPALSLHWYKELFTSKGRGGYVSLRALTNSLYFALFTTLSATILGTWAAFVVARKKALFSHGTEVLLLLPMGISSIILSLGLLSITSKGRFFSGDLAVIAAHTFIALPFVYRSVGSTLGQLNSSLRESALIQGATELQSLLKIELPLLKKTILSGALFSFALSMGEVNSVMILTSADRVTIPIAIYRLIGSYNFHGASAMGTLLIAVCLLAFVLLNYLDTEE